MRVLYVNHTSVVSGAEESLLVLLRSLSGQVEASVACPQGQLADLVRAAGISSYPIPGTDLSARLHPVHTTREIGKTVTAARAVRSLARRLKADLVHANTPRAGLMSAFAAGAAGAHPVVHIRDAVPPGRLPAAMFAWLARNASVFVVTSSYLAEQLPQGPPVRLVPNAVEPDRFDPGLIDRGAARSGVGLGPDEPVITVVGQISPHKGQRDAIEALHSIRRVIPNARLLIVGSVKFASAATRFDNRGYQAELVRLAERLDIIQAVSFLGERPDIASLLRATDVLLVPSWYEPFGRVAIEAMMMEVPVIATTIGGTREVVREGQDGLLLPPKQPELWAQAVIDLLSDEPRRKAMGRSGRARALSEFSPEGHARATLEIYEQVVASRR